MLVLPKSPCMAKVAAQSPYPCHAAPHTIKIQTPLTTKNICSTLPSSGTSAERDAPTRPASLRLHQESFVLFRAIDAPPPAQPRRGFVWLARGFNPGWWRRHARLPCGRLRIDSSDHRAVDAGLGSAQKLLARPQTVTPGSIRELNRKRVTAFRDSAHPIQTGRSPTQNPQSVVVEDVSAPLPKRPSPDPTRS